MATNIKQSGHVLVHTAASDISSGDLIEIGDIVGVAVADIDSGDDGAVRISGVAELPKAGAAGEITQGSTVYTSGGEITDSDTDDEAGIAFETAGASDETIRVLLNGMPGALNS